MANLVLQENIVEKRNILNEMRAVGWTLQELRFFALYLSRINARDQKTRHIKLKLCEFAQLMDVKRTDIRHIELVRDRLLQKIVVVPIANGKSAFQLFRKCDIEKDDNGEWHIDFDAHDDALPLMFEFKEQYVTYKVINVLRLKGENHIRMYEILKQYENLREITLSLEELRKRLGTEPKQYPVWKDFKRWVIEQCQKALSEHTDIKYTFEPIKKGSGKTSPVKAVKFVIERNEKPEQLSLLDEDEIDTAKAIKPEDQYSDFSYKSLATSFDYAFNDSQMKLIAREFERSPNAPKNLFEQRQFLLDVYVQLNYRRSKNLIEGKPLKNDFAYALGIIKNKLKNDEVEK